MKTYNGLLCCYTPCRCNNGSDSIAIYASPPVLKCNIYAKISPFNYLGTLSSNAVLSTDISIPGLSLVKRITDEMKETTFLHISVKPTYVENVSLLPNSMVLNCSTSEVITRLRNISELDTLVLSNIDTLSLEDIDFISSDS